MYCIVWEIQLKETYTLQDPNIVNGFWFDFKVKVMILLHSKV